MSKVPGSGALPSRRPSIAVRVLVVTLLAATLGAVTALVIGDRMVREAFVAQLAPELASRFDAASARACAAHPETWSMDVWAASGIRGYAYDLASGRSTNPAAPPFQRALSRRLGPEARATASDLRSGAGRFVIAFRTGAPPPCDVVQVIWKNPSAFRRWGVILGASAIASSVLACWLGLVALVLPLVRRIRRLRLAASRVGDPSGYELTEIPASAEPDDERGDELDAVSRALDRAHRRIRSDATLLEAQRDALERHLAHVAHDLRTPLTSLQVTLEYVADVVEDPEARDALAAALRDTVYLAGLTQNLQLASRLRTGWDPIADTAPVDLGDTVTRIAARARILARRRSLALDVSVPDEPVLVECNALAVEQALANVVDNAVAYGDPSGHVAVVLATMDTACSFTLEVRDDGPGVPPALLPTLGQLTFRSDEARRRDPRGSGLGLAITGEICARIGWSLAFEALEPRGLLVRISGSTAGSSPSARVPL